MASAQSGKKKKSESSVAEEKKKKSGSAGAKQKKTGGSTSTKKKTQASQKKSSASSNAKKTASAGTKRTKPASKQRVNGQERPGKKSRNVAENPRVRRNSEIFLVDNDAYDAYDRAPSAPRRSSKSDGSGGKRRRRGRDHGFVAVNLLLLTFVIVLAGVGVWRTVEYRAFAEMKAVVSRQTFYEGTTVEGVDVSDMTLPQAIEYWNSQIEPGHRQTAVTLDDGTQITAAELGYSSNYEQVLSGAWNYGRSGSLRQRYLRAATAGRSSNYEIERVNYDDALVRRYAAYLAEQVNAQAQNAHVKGFNTETYEFEFAAEAEGRRLDQEALVHDLEGALNAGGGSVARQIETIAPAVTLENVSSQYGMVSSAVTNASSSSSNRLSNIRLATSMINGICLHPGESFSFNEVVGKRTSDRGFKMATAYSGGSVTEEVGGGICQVSTTLFNAVVKADLKINERHPHSLTVSYVDLGKDAAVDWGNKDLKFTNTSDDDIYIVCQVSDDKRVRFAVFGKLLPNGETITLEGVNTGKVAYETQYQMSFELYTGETRQLQAGKDGYTATTYKIRWDADGNELSRTELCKSRYQATPEIIEYGP